MQRLMKFYANNASAHPANHADLRFELGKLDHQPLFGEHPVDLQFKLAAVLGYVDDMAANPPLRAAAHDGVRI